MSITNHKTDPALTEALCTVMQELSLIIGTDYKENENNKAVHEIKLRLGRAINRALIIAV